MLWVIYEQFLCWGTIEQTVRLLPFRCLVLLDVVCLAFVYRAKAYLKDAIKHGFEADLIPDSIIVSKKKYRSMVEAPCNLKMRSQSLQVENFQRDWQLRTHERRPAGGNIVMGIKIS